MIQDHLLEHGLSWLNKLPRERAFEELLKCCGSTNWAHMLEEKRPFGSIGELYYSADDVWSGLYQNDWLEAF
jgi:hypothetical protein